MKLGAEATDRADGTSKQEQYLPYPGGTYPCLLLQLELFFSFYPQAQRTGGGEARKVKYESSRRCGLSMLVGLCHHRSSVRMERFNFTVFWFSVFAV